MEEKAITYMDLASDFEGRIIAWSNQRDELKNVRLHLKPVTDSLSTGTPTTLSTDGTASFSEAWISSLPPDKQLGAANVSDAYQTVIDGYEMVDKLAELIIEYELDIAHPGKKKPTILLREAYNAYRFSGTDTVPSTSTLIPLRQAILVVMAELYRRRPIQEPNGGQRGKVLSIGRQVRRTDVPVDHVDTWARQWWKIYEQELNVSKEEMIDRIELRRRFNRAMTFLDGFIRGLDTAKLKPLK